MSSGHNGDAAEGEGAADFVCDMDVEGAKSFFDGIDSCVVGLGGKWLPELSGGRDEVVGCCDVREEFLSPCR